MSGSSTSDATRISMIQFDSKHLDTETNYARIEALVSAEAQNGSRLIVFPELATTGYLEPVTPDDVYNPAVTGDPTREAFLIRYAQLAESIPGSGTDRLAALASKNNVHIAVGMLEKIGDAPGLLANSIVLVGPNGVVGTQRKLHMPWNEKHVFVPGSELNVFRVDDLMVGFNVCYDAYFPELSRTLSMKGAHLIVSCFTGPTGDETDSGVQPDRASFISRARALENSVYFGSVNRTGKQGDYHFIGNSAIAGPGGELLAHTESIEEDTLSTEINPQKILKARLGLSPIRDRRPDLYATLQQKTLSSGD